MTTKILSACALIFSLSMPSQVNSNNIIEEDIECKNEVNSMLEESLAIVNSDNFLNEKDDLEKINTREALGHILTDLYHYAEPSEDYIKELIVELLGIVNSDNFLNEKTDLEKINTREELGHGLTDLYHYANGDYELNKMLIKCRY